MLISIFMVAVLGSVFGRKMVLLIGLLGTTTSVVAWPSLLSERLPSKKPKKCCAGADRT